MSGLKQLFVFTTILFLSGETLLAQSPGVIDLNSLPDYAGQTAPIYIEKDNTPLGNAITNEGATLGRVIFYDKRISVNNTIACASCHQQQFAFGDPANVSTGVNGTTGRHSMRLVNARFADETRFFWDERASSLEEQTTMPIQDHAEMGFSGSQGDPALDSLLTKMSQQKYYRVLFAAVYGDSVITEDRMQRAIAQFIRSIQSFDSRFDTGRAQVANDGAPFPNFSNQENQGKNLFLMPPQFNQTGTRVGGGVGCAGCHGPPEFDINPNSGNNGVVVSIGGGTDFTNTRAPSLRDVVDGNANLNGSLMHDAGFPSLLSVVNHYNNIQPAPGIDPRLTPGGNGQNLALTQNEKDNLVAFLETLTGSDIYANPIWSTPFDGNGDLTVIPQGTTGIEPGSGELIADFVLRQNYPNPFNPTTTIGYVLKREGLVQLSVFDLLGREVAVLVNQNQAIGSYSSAFDATKQPAGIYLYRLSFNGIPVQTKKMLLAK
ncbi:MAG: cytochrome c peroxidase [Calditrichia bacterium]